MADPSSFAKLVPGFDFLQGLMGGAAQGLPSMNQWIAPTLDPDELDKRIRDLRTVQFWLEQNAKMIGATVQALEVQRMTLATLKTMNLPMAELRESMRAPAGAPLATPAAEPAAEPAPKPARGKAGRAKAAPAAPGIDPMQWWNALTQQFGELATQAMKDMPAAAVAAGAAPAAPPKDDPPAAPARAPARRRSGSSRR